MGPRFFGLIALACVTGCTPPQPEQKAVLPALPFAAALVAEVAAVEPSPSPPGPTPGVCEDCNNTGCVGDGTIMMDCGTCGRTCNRATQPADCGCGEKWQAVNERLDNLEAALLSLRRTEASDQDNQQASVDGDHTNGGSLAITHPPVVKSEASPITGPPQVCDPSTGVCVIPPPQPYAHEVGQSFEWSRPYQKEWSEHFKRWRWLCTDGEYRLVQGYRTQMYDWPPGTSEDEKRRAREQPKPVTTVRQMPRRTVRRCLT